MTSKVEFRGTLRGVEFRGTAEFHDGQPGEGPKLVGIVWAEGFDPGLSDDDDEGWIEIEALAWNVYTDPPAWPPPGWLADSDPDPDVVW